MQVKNRPLFTCMRSIRALPPAGRRTGLISEGIVTRHDQFVLPDHRSELLADDAIFLCFPEAGGISVAAEPWSHPQRQSRLPKHRQLRKFGSADQFRFGQSGLCRCPQHQTGGVPSQLIALLSLNAATLSVVGSSSAFRPVTLTTVDGSPDNCTTLTLDPLGLSAPANQAGVAIGGFGINVPSYTPLPRPELYCGVVALNDNQAIILSSFVAPFPNAVMNCIPKQIFFVKMGYQPVGSTVTYDESNSACCDFTIGYAIYTVTYKADGTFSATGGP